MVELASIFAAKEDKEEVEWRALAGDFELCIQNSSHYNLEFVNKKEDLIFVPQKRELAAEGLNAGCPAGKGGEGADAEEPEGSNDRSAAAEERLRRAAREAEGMMRTGRDRESLSEKGR